MNLLSTIRNALGFARSTPQTVQRQALLEEIATRQAAGGLDLSAWLLSLPDPDPVLRKRGEDAQVLEELTSDDQVCMAMSQRRLRTLNRDDFLYKPGAAPGTEPDQAAARLCADLVADLENLDLRNLFSEVLNAPYFGFTPVELFWEPADGGRLRLTDAKAKPRRWFCFDADGRLQFKAMGVPQLVPEHKFVLARHDATYDNPYGMRLLSRCLWPVAFKRGGVQFWMTFAERYGSPWTTAVAGSGMTPAERRQMAADLATMVQDAVLVVPLGTEIKMESASGSYGDLHQNMVRHWDAAIAKVLMGQTLSAEAGGSKGEGSLALGQVHGQTLEALAKDDEAMLCAFMNELAWSYARVNAPEGVLAPVFRSEEAEDLAARADLDIKLVSMGARFKAKRYVEVYGVPPEHLESITQDENPAKPKGLAFADPSGPAVPAEPGLGALAAAQAAVDALAETLIAQARKDAAAGVAELVDQASRAEGYEDMLLLTAEALPELSRIQVEALARGVLAAEMAGRLAVDEEASADD